MMDGMMGMGWMMVLWVLVGLAVLTLLIVGIMWLVRSLGDRNPSKPQASDDDAAERQLRNRYAAGDIDHDEYARRLDTLRQR